MSRASIAGLIALLCGCGAAAPTDDFEAIREEVCAGRYEAAIPKLKAYRGPEESRAGLFLGKAYAATGDYAAARAAWEAVVRNHPGSLEDHKCRYKLAWLSFIEGDEAEALASFESLASEPDGPLAAEATAFAAYLRER